jgi:hypothetical protein
MARAWEADFIRLWESGATQGAIAAALGIPPGMVESRAHALIGVRSTNGGPGGPVSIGR